MLGTRGNEAGYRRLDAVIGEGYVKGQSTIDHQSTSIALTSALYMSSGGAGADRPIQGEKEGMMEGEEMKRGKSG